MGFSAVIFALKVVLFHDSPGYSNVFGFRLPTKVWPLRMSCGQHGMHCNSEGCT